MPPRSGGRVAGRHCCLPAPQEPYVKLSPHTAQALVNAPSQARGRPIGLGADLDVTSTVPATEMTSVAGAAPATAVTTAPTVLLCPLRRSAARSRPPTPEGS